MKNIFEYKITNVYDRKGISITGTPVNVETLEIPEEIDGLPVLEIAPNAFADRKKIINVVFPKNLIQICSSAFDGCSGIENITFPDTLEVIGPHAFDSCVQLCDVNFNEGLELIEHNAFHNCNILKLILPNSLVEIEERAFRNNPITHVHFGSKLEVLGYAVFEGCYLLESLKFLDSLLSLGYDAISGCNSLQWISFGKNLEDIGSYNDFAFECYDLKDIIVDPENKDFCSINGAFYDKNEKVLIRVPPNMGINTFAIPKWVKRLASGCLNDLRLDNVIIYPKTVKGLSLSCIDLSKNISCIKDSDVEAWAKLQRFDSITQLSTSINDFLEELIEEEKTVK